MTTSIACCIFALDQSLYNSLCTNQPLLTNAQGRKDQHVVHALCDNLEQNLDIAHLQNDNNEGFHEKLTVMVIDGAIRLGDDPIRVSSEFNRRGITLAIVAIVTPVDEIWDFYHELARNTGGEYMLLANAYVVLPRVVSSVLTGEDTLRQAFLHERGGHIPSAK